MAVEEKKKSYRVFVGICCYFYGNTTVKKLSNIIWVEGDYYRKLAKTERLKHLLFRPIKEISILQMVVLCYIYTKLYHSFDALAPNAKDLK
jgi:cell division protein FtsI (penicillin-binding protein 3)